MATPFYKKLWNLFFDPTPAASHFEELAQDSPYHFDRMPLPHEPDYASLIEKMRGVVVSVGYNRDVSASSYNTVVGKRRTDSSREDAECFVVDRHGGIHTLMIHLREAFIGNKILEDHAEDLARTLGVEFVRF